MNNLSVTEQAYIAGFLDGDGSIYIRLKPNATYRYRYQIAPYIVFFQAMKERHGLEKMQRMIGAGYLRNRKDGIVEYTIGDMPSIVALLTAIRPHLLLKQQQADVMLAVIDRKRSVQTAQDFIELCRMIDQFQSLNYSKRRVQMTPAVQQALQQEGLLTP